MSRRKMHNCHVRLSKGFGNALFQWSFYLYVKSFLNSSAILDARLLSPLELAGYFEIGLITKDDVLLTKLQKFSLRSRFLTKWVGKAWNLSEYLDFRFNCRIVKTKISYTIVDNFSDWRLFTKDNLPSHISGYFQDVDLVNRVSLEIRKKLKESNLFKFSQATKFQDETVIHRRLGDFLLASDIGIINKYYFREASAMLDGSLSNKVYLVTDSPNLALNEFLNLGLNVLKIEHQKMGILQHFEAMYSSKSLIISNSTFSWWAGYLGKLTSETKIVIGPNPWRKDLKVNSLFFEDFIWLPVDYD
jgi:hypothetical protein